MVCCKFSKRVSIALSAAALIAGDGQVGGADIVKQPIRTLVEQRTTGVAFSPDGEIALTVLEGLIMLWDLETGMLIRKFGESTEETLGAVFSPDGSVIGSFDYKGGTHSAGEVSMWDARTGERLYTLDPGYQWGITSIAMSPDGRLAAIGTKHQDMDEPKGVLLWNAESGGDLREFSEARSGYAVVFSPDGNHLATGETGGLTRLWSVGTGEEVRRFDPPAPMGSVSSVAFSPDGRFLVTGHDDRTARLWDAETGEPLHTLQGHDHDVWGVAFAPDGNSVLTGSRRARLWDAETGVLLRLFDPATGGGTLARVAFDRDGRRVLIGGDAARLWDIRDVQAMPRVASSEFGHEIHWNLGSLQFSRFVEGPWTDLPAASPFQLSPVGEKGFFRVVVEE